MLTAPPEPDHCEIVVRVPAAEGAEIGGDWYDAFLQEDGGTVLAIGDVAGHDTRAAAAAMGQVRGLLRGIGYSSGGTPAQILTELDRAVQASLDTMATALVGRLEESEEDLRAGRTWFRWSSAGHPAPILIDPDGDVVLLDGVPADLLLGVAPNMHREDRVACLTRGTTVLLYTDGLVERRDRDVDAGTDEPMTALREYADLPLTELCDRVLERLFLPDAEDDVALLAVRLHPQGRPVPAGRGRGRSRPTSGRHRRSIRRHRRSGESPVAAPAQPVARAGRQVDGDRRLPAAPHRQHPQQGHQHDHGGRHRQRVHAEARERGSSEARSSRRRRCTGPAARCRPAGRAGRRGSPPRRPPSLSR